MMYYGLVKTTPYPVLVLDSKFEVIVKKLSSVGKIDAFINGFDDYPTSLVANEFCFVHAIM